MIYNVPEVTQSAEQWADAMWALYSLHRKAQIGFS